MFGLGPAELVIILALALLIFGPKKLPVIGRSIGSAMRELRRASNDFMSAVENDEAEEDEKIENRTWNDEPETEQKPEFEQTNEDEADKPKEGE
ncbi:MAG: twin-arginine translocase TatA/TatE family subunit [Phycisphaerales bacterium]|nr:twin-arginine translocase TatA/TatE family subunit [Phycisphaerales bacterium]